MKSKSDEEFFDELSSRLKNYSEEPDDALWDKISPFVKPQRIGWKIYASAIITTAFLFFLFPIELGREHGRSNSKAITILNTLNHPATIKDNKTIISYQANNSFKIKDEKQSGNHQKSGKFQKANPILKAKDRQLARLPVETKNTLYDLGSNLKTSAERGDYIVIKEKYQKRKEGNISEKDSVTTNYFKINEISKNKKRKREDTIIGYKKEVQIIPQISTPTIYKKDKLSDLKSINRLKKDDLSSQNRNSDLLSKKDEKSELLINVECEEKTILTHDGIKDSNTIIIKTENSIADTIIPKKTQIIDSLQRNPILEKNKKNREGAYFYFIFEPSLSYQKIQPLPNDNITIDRVNSLSFISGKRLGISFEAGVQGKISNKWEYYSGISYYLHSRTIAYQYKNDQVNYIENTNVPMSYTITPIEQNGNMKYEIRNFGAQFGLLYLFNKNKIVHKIGGGLSFQRNIKKDDQDSYNDSKSNYLFYNVFYRSEYKVNEALKIFLQPNYSHIIYSNEQQGKYFKLMPYRLGISFGLLYHF